MFIFSVIYRPKYFGGIYLLLGWNINFPPHTPVIHGDINCQLLDRTAPMTLFAFRTHAHKHGTVITGYLYRGNQLSEIARGDPQKPQMFYAMKNELVVDNGDFLAARCTFNTTMEDKPIYIGTRNTTIIKYSAKYVRLSCLPINY